LNLKLIYLLSISTAIIIATVSSKNKVKYIKYVFLLLLVLAHAHFGLFRLAKFDAYSHSVSRGLF